MCCKHEGAKEISIFHSDNLGSPCTIFRAKCCMCRQHASDLTAVPWKNGQKKLNGGPFDVFQTVVRFGKAVKTKQPFGSEITEALCLILASNPDALRNVREQFTSAKPRLKEEVREYLVSVNLDQILRGIPA